MSTMFLTDNRYATGASGATLPDPGNVVAAYAARWIDGNGRADILPDRQGFAYDTPAQRDLLIALLSEEEPHLNYAHVDRDDAAHLIVDRTDGQVWARRAGGYVYVDAWIWS